MMAMILILNIALLPFGIIPATLAEVAIAKSREHGVEDRFVQIMQTAKLAGEGSKEKLSELIDYAGEAGKNVKEKLTSFTDETGSTVSRLFDKSKKLFGKLSTKSKKDDN